MTIAVKEVITTITLEFDESFSSGTDIAMHAISTINPHSQNSKIGSVSIGGVKNGMTYEFNITPLITWELGCWNYQIFAETDTTTNYLQSGSFIVAPSYKNIALEDDYRTQLQKDYDILEEAIRDYGRSNIISYTISGRQVNKLSLSELRRLRNEVLKKLNQERKSMGLPIIKTGYKRSFSISGVYR